MKETEYAGSITHFHLLLHVVTLDNEALVPWHQFTYSVLVRDGRLAIQPVHESKERFAIQRYLLIIGKKQNMQVLSHTFTYFST